MALAYIMIGTNDLARARIFYDPVFGAIGGEIEADHPGMAFCYRFANDTRAWVAGPHDRARAVPANGSMPGFGCASRETVDAAHAAAMAHGGSDEGAPGPRPLYGPNFYGAYVRDPDGNKMSFFFDA